MQGTVYSNIITSSMLFRIMAFVKRLSVSSSYTDTQTHNERFYSVIIISQVYHYYFYQFMYICELNKVIMQL